jgi:ABC-type antimicrobial peptide transport system permease subunit
VAIVNESLRRQLFPAGDAIGRSIRVGKDPSRRVAVIVGVVSDAAIGSYRLPHVPVVFRPRLQELQAFGPAVVFRTSGDPAAVDRAMEAVIARVGRERQLGGYWSLQELIDRALIQERLLAAVSSFFAGLAVLLAFVGVYSAIGYAVARRTREIGVRIALGASRRTVMRMVVGHALLVTLAGIAIGVPCALGAGRWIRSLLFGLSPSDPLAIVAAASFFVVVGALAGLFPALRACSVDPATALRSE